MHVALIAFWLQELRWVKQQHRDQHRDNMVLLDVGGTLWECSRALLCNGGGSNLLESMCSGRFGDCTSEGTAGVRAYFLDRYHPSLEGVV